MGIINQAKASSYQQSDTRISVIICSSRKVVPYKSHFGDYAALSYVWGTATRLSADMTDCLPNHIPKTVRDALTVCTELGIPYLWVDRYYIPQDNLEERNRQISIMDEIYFNSALIIIAAAGDNLEHGLPGVNGTLRTTEFRSLALGQDNWLHLSDDMFRKKIQDSAWNSKAWTYQEGIVSRRRLVFTKSQVHFECPTKNPWEVIYVLPDYTILSNIHDATLDFGKVTMGWKS